MKATMFFVWNVLGFWGFFFYKCKKKAISPYIWENIGCDNLMQMNENFTTGKIKNWELIVLNTLLIRLWKKTGVQQESKC